MRHDFAASSYTARASEEKQGSHPESARQGQEVYVEECLKFPTDPENAGG